MIKVAIVIPAYNEEKRIAKTLQAYSSYFEELRNRGLIDYSFLISINNTTDKTKEIVEIFSKTNKRIKYIDLPKGGKGYAVKEGFKKILVENYDLIGFVDADMATSPEEYYKLIRQIENYDGIIADRYIKGSKIYPPVTLKRLYARKLFNFVIRSILLLPYRDTQCGAKIFTKRALEKSLPSLSMSRWAFDVDLLFTIRKKGFKIFSAPTIWIDKEYSKINFWEAGPFMALAILRLRILNSPIKSLIRIYDKSINRIFRLTRAQKSLK